MSLAFGAVETEWHAAGPKIGPSTEKLLLATALGFDPDLNPAATQTRKTRARLRR